MVKTRIGRIEHRSGRTWYRVHKGTSLACTVFLLVLCLTGLPLVFHDEIDDLLGVNIKAPPSDVQAKAPISKVLAAALRAYPGLVPQFIVWDQDEPDIILLNLARSRPAPRGTQRIVAVDARTTTVLGEKHVYRGLTAILLQIHKDLFLGFAGSLLLGLMGALFVVATISGIVVYGPIMRKHPFGILRQRRRIRWLDFHNLLGITTVCWTLVVGATGIINTWAEPLIATWQASTIAAVERGRRDRPLPDAIADIDNVLAQARRAAPKMSPAFVAFPEMPAAGMRDFLVVLRGDTSSTARLLQPVLIDAMSSEVTGAPHVPWYIVALLISQPLHFGDYGGLPLKIIWVLLDAATIFILGTGLYLWWIRPRQAQDPEGGRLSAGDIP